MVPGQSTGVSPAKHRERDRPPRDPEDAIREELNRVLASHEFRASKRSQDFLRYVIENTLTGHSDMLKERTIGIEVFGRSTSYEPSDDATVRVKAGDVRKRLGLYYAELGAHNPVRIELPAGTYVPEFRWSDAPAVASPPIDEVETPVAPGSHSRFRTNPALLIGGVAFLICLGAGIVLWERSRPANTVLDQFWAPVISETVPVSICAAFNPEVYRLNRDPRSTQPIRAEDFVLLTDQFVGGGDLIATSRLAAMLTRMQRPFRVRLGNAVSFQDLRSAPAILVGYSYTRWKEISSQMRFFIRDAAPDPVGITDNGAATKWTLPNLPADRRTTEDYAIVSRVFHPDTNAMLVEVSGITQYGTEAAAELVTNQDLLAEALRKAPADWKKKNLQLVLHVKVISGTPSSPTIVATHFW